MAPGGELKLLPKTYRPGGLRGEAREKDKEKQALEQGKGKGKDKGKGQGKRDKGQGTRADKGQGTRDEGQGTRAREKGKGQGQGTVRGWGRYGAPPVGSSLRDKSLSTREMNEVGEGPGYHMLQREPGVTWCLFPA